MKVTTKYISWEFLKFFFLCQAVFIFLYLLGDFVLKINDFAEAGVSFKSTAVFFIAKIPFITVEMMPYGTMISAVVLICIMKKNFEITAMKACGLNLLNVFQPLIVISLILSAATFVLSESVVPYASRVSNEIRDIEVKKITPAAAGGKTGIRRKSGNNIYLIKYFDVTTKTMKNPSFYFIDDNFDLQKKIDAEACTWESGTWILKDGVMYTWEKDGTVKPQKFTEKPLIINETPETFMEGINKPEEMSYMELKRQAEKVRAEGYDNTPDLVDLNFKMARPLTSTVFILLAIPIALWKRSMGVPISITGGIAICFLHRVVMELFGRPLGIAGVFPPFLSAWAANILFILLGSNFLMSIKR